MRLLDRLRTERYIVLCTYRRDGSEVRTPVWCAVVDDRLAVRTGRGTGKVKRIRHTPRVRLAPSDARGRPVGAFVDAEARIVSDRAWGQRAEEALLAKYGWQARLLMGADRLRGAADAAVYLELRLAAPDPGT